MKGLVFLQDRINRIFEERLRSIYTASEIDEGANWSPAVDIYETEREIYLSAELPGVDLENIRVEVADSELVLSGYRPFPKEGLRRENYQRLECGYGHFERKFHLPTAVDQNRISAGLRDGVLKVVLPKSPEPERTRIEIEKP
jgi:HSP20 family protein